MRRSTALFVVLFAAPLLASTTGTPGVLASRSNGKVATGQAARGVSAIRVPALGPCPAWRNTYRDVVNSGSVLRTTLLPKGALFGRICRYGEQAGSSRVARIRAALINGRAAHDFEAIIGSLKTGSPPGGAVNCPASLPGVTVLAFGYTGGKTIDLWFDGTGCKLLDNGYIKAYGPNNWNSLQQLMRLVDLIAPIPASVS